MDKQSVLQKCTVSGNVVMLPLGQLDRKLYMEVANALELIGGKWTRKVNGFQFKQDPTSLLAQIANGEKRNLKKEFQFFETPAELADEMVRYADITPSSVVLEPSAGQGAIIKAIHRAYPGKAVNYHELMNLNLSILSDIPYSYYCGSNFLDYHDQLYDCIIANPPFSKNQDIDHIRHMWKVLKPGGRIVTIASKHWLYSTSKKETTFKEWIYNEVEADVTTVEAGAFSESGTKIETVMLILQKPTE